MDSVLIRVGPGLLSLADCVRDFEAVPSVKGSETGALATFSGIVRPTEDGRQIIGLEYDFYAGMAEAELERIGKEVLVDLALNRVGIWHRTGLIAIGEAAVVIISAGERRAAAFESLRVIMDRIKESVPIWKTVPAGGGQP